MVRDIRQHMVLLCKNCYPGWINLCFVAEDPRVHFDHEGQPVSPSVDGANCSQMGMVEVKVNGVGMEMEMVQHSSCDLEERATRNTSIS